MSPASQPDRVPTSRVLLETVHALAAGLWLGALVMSGVTAGVLFSTMPGLEPTFGRYAAYTGDHAVLGAGFLQNRVFLALDVAQYACGTLTLAATIGMLVFAGLPLRRWSTALRLVGLGAAMVLLSFHLFVLTPRMQENVRAYWAAAETGDTEAAETHRAAFNADHPTASRTLGGLAVSVSLLLGAGAWSAASATGRDDDGPAMAGRTSRYEEPALSRKGRG